MKPKEFLRGHEIYSKDGVYYYADTDEPTVGNRRSCGYCGLADTSEGHDGCLGTLPGVMNACCGHGERQSAYVQFSDEKVVRGREALKTINNLRS